MTESETATSAVRGVKKLRH